jgi:histidyl-tRNA synthetase
MSKKMKPPKQKRLQARLPNGFADRSGDHLRAQKTMLDTIAGVYESYGFEPMETPAFEYTECLGKFLPDTDRPNEGVFSLQDEDEQWLSLRYDLTAPLARHVAEHFQETPKPLRSYRMGYVYRNEKPGPGRFRQFIQCDADIVGAPDVAADAEMCMMMADTLDALGLEGQYVIRVNNRKILDGVMEAIGIGGEDHAATRLAVMRAIDKLDKFGIEGVKLLLGKGREDESGDFTKGAGLSKEQIKYIITQIQCKTAIDLQNFYDNVLTSKKCEVSDPQLGLPILNYEDALLEVVEQFIPLISHESYKDKIIFDPSVVRGLDYYTGMVFEAEVTFPVTNDKGEEVRFGSVGGGGRYDGLISRFRPEVTPCTGFSIGVSRLMTALQSIGQLQDQAPPAPVLISVMDKDRMADYQAMARDLRTSGIRAEVYLGGSGMKAQFKYADRRGSPCVVIQGSDEHDKGIIQIKDMQEGKKLSANIDDNEQWRKDNPAQFEAPRGDLVDAVRKVLARSERYRRYELINSIKKVLARYE